MSNKILFLDFDGVLSTRRTGLAYGEFLWDSFDPVGAKILNRICDATGAKIVCTSTRAFNNSLRWKALRPVFERSGLDLSNIHKDWSCNTGFTKNVKREHHIWNWLELHPEVTHHAIIDDDIVMLPNYVPMDEDAGITAQSVERIAECLEVDAHKIYRSSFLSGAFNRGQLMLPYDSFDENLNKSILKESNKPSDSVSL